MKRKPYRTLLYLLFRVSHPVVLGPPRRAALGLGRRIGELAFYLIPRERERTLEHLRLAFGADKTSAEIWELGRKVFLHFGEIAMEVLRFPCLTREKVNELVDTGEGFRKMDQVLSEGNGVILLTAHLGNWEMLGPLFRLNGYRGAAVGRRINDSRFNEVIVSLREQVTLRTIYHDASPREYLKVLNQNEILGILADQDIDRLEGIFVPFFGRLAHTLTAPVKLALASGAPLVPTFLIKDGERYRLEVEEPIRVEIRGSREESIEDYTRQWSQVIEEKIRRYPEQWAWMHRRWKTQPEPTGEFEGAVRD